MYSRKTFKRNIPGKSLKRPRVTSLLQYDFWTNISETFNKRPEVTTAENVLETHHVCLFWTYFIGQTSDHLCFTY